LYWSTVYVNNDNRRQRDYCRQIHMHTELIHSQTSNYNAFSFALIFLLLLPALLSFPPSALLIRLVQKLCLRTQRQKTTERLLSADHIHTKLIQSVNIAP
jgi:hypothetical protein